MLFQIRVGTLNISEVQITEYDFDIVRLPIVLVAIQTPVVHKGLGNDGFQLVSSHLLQLCRPATLKMGAAERQRRIFVLEPDGAAAFVAHVCYA